MEPDEGQKVFFSSFGKPMLWQSAVLPSSRSVRYYTPVCVGVCVGVFSLERERWRIAGLSSASKNGRPAVSVHEVGRGPCPRAKAAGELHHYQEPCHDITTGLQCAGEEARRSTNGDRSFQST